jgi:hypothetical protein
MVKGFELDFKVMESLNDSENKHTSGHKLSKWWKKKNVPYIHKRRPPLIWQWLMKVEIF